MDKSLKKSKIDTKTPCKFWGGGKKRKTRDHF